MTELTPEEKETICGFDLRDRKWHVTTCIPLHITRLTSIHGPGKTIDQFGTQEWTLSEKAICFMSNPGKGPREKTDPNPDPDMP